MADKKVFSLGAQAIKLIPELREGDGDAFASMDAGFTRGDLSRYRERHGDAVIVERRQIGAFELGGALNDEAILLFFNFATHRAEIGGNGFEPIGFLKPQFLQA